MQLLLQEGNKKTERVWHATLTRRKQITYALAFMAHLFLVLIDVDGYIKLAKPAAQDIRVLVDSHLMLSKHVNRVCKSAFFSVSNIGRIGKQFPCEKNSQKSWNSQEFLTIPRHASQDNPKSLEFFRISRNGETSDQELLGIPRNSQYFQD